MTLEEYIESLTGIKPEPVLLSILRNSVGKFNDMQGFKITPIFGDYDVSQITIKDTLSQDLVEDILAVLTEIRENLVTYSKVLLYSNYIDVEQDEGYVYDLSESYLNFDAVEVLFSYGDTIPEFINGTPCFISSKALKMMMDSGVNSKEDSLQIFTEGFNYFYIHPLSEKEFIVSSKYKLGLTVIREIYGVKYNKKVFEE